MVTLEHQRTDGHFPADHTTGRLLRHLKVLVKDLAVQLNPEKLSVLRLGASGVELRRLPFDNVLLPLAGP